MFEYKKIGQIKPICSSKIKTSPVGIGLEKLDRDVFDPEPCYDSLGELGVKWVRLQSGWAKTEHEKGIYDFEWLDKIVDNLICRGITPWLCLCYGNALYDERANGLAGGIGCPPIHTQQMKDAWAAYCTAVARHYTGRVACFEIWNEPDGKWCWKHGVNAKEYGVFAKETAIAVLKGNPDAKIFGGAFCCHDLSWLNTVLKEAAEYFDAVTFHDYTTTPEYNNKTDGCIETTDMYYKNLRALLDMYNPDIEIIMGETGCHSEYSTKGAVDYCNWTPEKQTKLLLRRILTDTANGSKFSSYFSCVDMYENLNGDAVTKNHDDYGFYGVIGEKFENGIATGEYYKKPSYFALQTLCALLADSKLCKLPITLHGLHSTFWWSDNEPDDPRYRCAAFELADGRKAYAYWIAADILTQTVDTTISMRAINMKTKPELVDLRDGSVYEIPDEKVEWLSDTDIIIKHLRLTDYPQMLIF